MENRNRARFRGFKKGRTKLYMFAAAIVTAIGAAIVSGIGDVSRNLVSENVVPAMTSAWFHVYGIFNPLPEHHDYHFSVTFFNPPSEGKPGTEESTGVSIPGEKCSKSEGVTSYKSSSSDINGWQTYVITEVFCSSHGVTVTLIPQAGGEKQIIYDDLFYEDKKIPFPGVPGRYNAGVLWLLSTDRSEPQGEWEPVNECQKDGTC